VSKTKNLAVKPASEDQFCEENSSILIEFDFKRKYPYFVRFFHCKKMKDIRLQKQFSASAVHFIVLYIKSIFRLNSGLTKIGIINTVFNINLN